MPRLSRPARAARHGSIHSTKRTLMKGNNLFGSKGCMKCDECRRRKTRCVFDVENPLEPCFDCKKRGIPCEKALPQQTSGRSECSISSSSPCPSDTSSHISDPSYSDTINVKLEPQPALDKVPPVVVLQKITHCAQQRQNENPSLSNAELLAEIREWIEFKRFGDICGLLNPTTPRASHSHTTNTSHSSSNFHVAGYPAYNNHMPYPQHVTAAPHAIAGTVNPATLSMYMDTTAQYYGDSDSTHPDLEFEAPYNYVSYLGGWPDLTVKDTPIAGQTAMLYNAYH